MYPDSEVLRNLADIHDEQTLKDLEGVLGNISIEYSDCLDIVKEASRVLSHMNRVEWEKETFDSVVVKFSDFLAELWKTHPFREGNTRTIVTFCCLFIEAQGIYIESELFKDNAAYVRND